MAYVSDVSLPLLGLFLSAYISFRCGIIGLVFGTAIFLVSQILRLEVLMYLDSEYSPGMLGALWVSPVGWVIALAWCLLFYIAKLLANLVKRRKCGSNSAT